jgi:GT2 family glycosyltransferase
VPDVDISVVAYRPELPALAQLVASIAEQTEGLAVDLLVFDNSPEEATTERISAAIVPHQGAFSRVEVVRSAENVGFGRGQNANAARGRAPFLLALNQDCILEPGILAPLVAYATADAAGVAAWELRQIPYEHPKAYDPVTLETPWASGAATLFRRSAFDAVGGFDPKIFMYGEDVDLSWRLRARGLKLRYLPRFGVVHRTYSQPEEVKPLQVIGGVQTNLCLRARFGGPLRTLQGFSMLAAEVLAPQDFPGRRRGLVKAFLRFLMFWPHFLRTRVQSTLDFTPIFVGWSYEQRRDGAFVPFRSQREAPRQDIPLVSILIRTVDRGAWLTLALESVANQTWRNLEVIVVEDGPPRSRAVAERFSKRFALRYFATGTKVGRARAGNLALAEARGEWLNFLDDDDVFFADHVETLVGAVERAGTKGAYALAWETHIQVRRPENAAFVEIAHFTCHRQPFDRITLWHHNFLPIQAVLFHRSLYERYGGFAEDMEQLEDWNLWTRYTLENDFVLVEKTTSKYRVPANAREAASRQELLDRAYQDAVMRQRVLQLTLSPYDISRMAEDYVRSQSVVMVSRADVRRFVDSRPWLSRLAAWRHPVTRRFKGRSAAR